MRIRTTSAAGLPRGGVFRRRRHPTDKCAPNKMFHRGVRGRTLPRRLSRADPVADQHSQTQRSARGVESAATMITVDRGAREPPHGLPRRPVNEPRPRPPLGFRAVVRYAGPSSAKSSIRDVITPRNGRPRWQLSSPNPDCLPAAGLSIGGAVPRAEAARRSGHPRRCCPRISVSALRRTALGRGHDRGGRCPTGHTPPIRS